MIIIIDTNIKTINDINWILVSTPLFSSNVYGSDEETELKLRSDEGLLTVNTIFGKELLPEYPEAEGCDPQFTPFCFLAGKF